MTVTKSKQISKDNYFFFLFAIVLIATASIISVFLNPSLLPALEDTIRFSSMGAVVMVLYGAGFLGIVMGILRRRK